MKWLFIAKWSPYVSGIGIGILSWLTFALSDKPIGCSTAYARTSGMIECLFRGSKVRQKPYYKKYVPEINWGWMLVAGIFIGACLSATLSGQFQVKWIPDLWARHFGHLPFLRWIVALAGGIIMGFGARWADGCTSGHGISGTLQLAVSGWLAAICFFAGGVTTAMVIYKGLGG